MAFAFRRVQHVLILTPAGQGRGLLSLPSSAAPRPTLALHLAAKSRRCTAGAHASDDVTGRSEHVHAHHLLSPSWLSLRSIANAHLCMHDIAAMAQNTFSLASRTKAWRAHHRCTEAPALTLAACQWLVHAHHPPRCLFDIRERDVPGGPLGARGMRLLFLVRPAGCSDTDAARPDIGGKVTAHAPSLPGH
jgi:hypothetical protein